MDHADRGRQEFRAERLRVGIAATLMMTGMAVAISLAGFIAMRDALVFVAGAGVCVAVFHALVRSGANLRFRDPNMTVPMLLVAGALITYLVLTGPLARPAFISFYLIAFMFGVLTLESRRLVRVAIAYVGFYAAMIGISAAVYGEAAGLERESFRLLFFSLLIAWFTVLGAHIGDLRAKLRRTSEELSAALARAEALATIDPLTGCNNRRHVVTQLEAEARRVSRGDFFCVCLADLDRFKLINDTFGHAAGDEVLSAFVATARGNLRPSDSLGRWGGEEFLILLPQTSCADAVAVAERVRAMMESAAIAPLPKGRRATVSIGVAEHKAGELALQTVERADLALYRAKQAGRNRVEIAA